MECEIAGVIILWFLGLFLRGKFYDWRRRHYHNDSWKYRKK